MAVGFRGEGVQGHGLLIRGQCVAVPGLAEIGVPERAELVSFRVRRWRFGCLARPSQIVIRAAAVRRNSTAYVECIAQSSVESRG